MSWSGRLIAILLALAAVAGIGWRITARHHDAPPSRLPTAGPTTREAASRSPRVAPISVSQRPLGALTHPVQDAAAASAGAERVILLGGITAAGTSSDEALLVSRGRDRLRGRLPGPLHDAAAVSLAGATYLFGGGNGSSQTDRILRVDVSTGGVTVAGRLPAPSSDQAAAVIRGRAYVVGGFTGSQWLDTIVSWQPGAQPSVVAHLPAPLRYAAVTAVADRLVIAGGSTPDGAASAAVLSFDPATRRVTTIGRLLAGTTHAAAASLGNVAYVIGGRGATPGTPTRRIVAVAVRSGRIRLAGRLAAPVSDLAAVSLDSRILPPAGGAAAGPWRSSASSSQGRRPARRLRRRAPAPSRRCSTLSTCTRPTARTCSAPRSVERSPASTSPTARATPST